MFHECLLVLIEIFIYSWERKNESIPFSKDKRNTNTYDLILTQFASIIFHTNNYYTTWLKRNEITW